MIKRIIWYSVAAIAMIGFVSMTAGFYWAMSLSVGTNDQTNIKADATPKPDNNEVTKKANSIYFTIMGDSIAKGTGDETAKGFTGNLPDALRTKTSKEVLTEKVAIDGLRSDGLLVSLQSGKLDSALKISDFILISIGGNDLRTLQRKDETAKEQNFINLQNQYLNNLKENIRIIRQINRNALIIFIGLYNPYVTTGSFVDSGLVRAWNYNTQQLVEADDRAVFISTYDLIKFNAGKYIYQDRLHPNSAGYQAISDRIVDSIESVVVNK